MMMYSEAVKSIFKIMEEREDITEIIIDRERDSFSVISKDGSEHICFGDEFRNKQTDRRTV